MAKNELGPEPGGALFLKSVVSGVLWRGLEKLSPPAGVGGELVKGKRRISSPASDSVRSVR